MLSETTLSYYEGSANAKSFKGDILLLKIIDVGKVDDKDKDSDKAFSIAAISPCHLVELLSKDSM